MDDELSIPRISVDVDGDDVMVYFSWSCARFDRPVYMSRGDGNAALGLSRDGAQELRRQLGEKLDKQDWAEAGHPDTEEAMAEAEARVER